jgi:hypothetical protein
MMGHGSTIPEFVNVRVTLTHSPISAGPVDESGRPVAESGRVLRHELNDQLSEPCVSRIAVVAMGPEDASGDGREEMGQHSTRRPNEDAALFARLTPICSGKVAIRSLAKSTSGSPRTPGTPRWSCTDHQGRHRPRRMSDRGTMDRRGDGALLVRREH